MEWNLRRPELRSKFKEHLKEAAIKCNLGHLLDCDDDDDVVAEAEARAGATGDDADQETVNSHGSAAAIESTTESDSQQPTSPEQKLLEAEPSGQEGARGKPEGSVETGSSAPVHVSGVPALIGMPARTKYQRLPTIWI